MSGGCDRADPGGVLIRRSLALAAFLLAALLVSSLVVTRGPASASPAGGVAHDPAATALNIIPSGQYGVVPPPDGADAQALMYDGLTPLFDRVTNADLTTYFKSQGLRVGPDGPARTEEVPREGVTVTRDRFNVPHVRATTYDGGIWAAGWIVAQDHGLLIEQARYNARVAAIDAPGLSAIGLVTTLQSFEPSEQTEAVVARQTRMLRAAGRDGRAVLRDIDTFVSGINAYLVANSPGTEGWTRRDVYALNALKGQFLGQGGGDEARRTQFLAGLQQRLGFRRGFSVFNDLRQFKNPDAPTSVDGRFAYGHVPRNRRGNVIIDPGSFRETPAAPRRVLPRSAPPLPDEASNTLMIAANRSRTGRPLMVGGPQIGYFYPGLTHEINMDAPGLRWRGITSSPFPGYLLIGRGRDFATTLTSAGADIIDQFAVRLCDGSNERYRFRGRCRAMERFDAGTLNGEPVSFLRTVHGPVVGYATVNGRGVAIASKRASYGRDVLDQLFFRRLSTGQVRNPRTFFNAAARTPQTFNSFYIDNENVAMYTSGRLPLRHRDVDPGLLTNGNGRFEWRGILPKRRLPRGVNPRGGVMTNWNNNAARGFGASDSSWGRSGSVGRVDLLDRNLDRLISGGRWSLASVTAAMNAAATQDVRAIVTVPLLRRLLRGPRPAGQGQGAGAPSQQAQTMLDLLVRWHGNGGSRLDRDLDGEIDDPGAAIMDAAWPKIADALMAPQLGPQLDELDSLFSRFDQPPGGQFSGWYQYFDRDIRNLLGMRVGRPFQNSYCGAGDREDCRESIWEALAQAGEKLTEEQGTGNPAAWRADATAERISFAPGILPTTIRYTNRPSGSQQVISFGGGR